MAMAHAPFREGWVEAGGARMRYAEAGEGAPLVHLHAAGTLRLTAAHDLLCRRLRVVAIEMPPGEPAALAPIVARALHALGLETFNLMATSLASPAALRLVLQAPHRVLAVVLEAPAASDAEPDLQSRLATLVTPTLLLVGTRAIARARYDEMLPKCHLVFVYDAGTAIAADRPEAFVEVVADFLDRHEAFDISRAATVIHP
jgi:pimeloyl-ACP methyl ester carboxylesterase